MPKINPSGPVATGTANVITIGLLLWGLAGTTVIALALTLWKTTRDLLFSPAGAVFAVVWFLLILTGALYLALRLLSKPREVMVTWDCAYCIAMEGVGIGYDKNSRDKTLQVQAGFRNTGNGPIRLKAEQFRATLGDRVVPEGPPFGEIIIPRISTKGVTSNHFKKEAIPARGGVIEFELVLIYGRHDGNYSRRFKLKGRVNVTLAENGDVAGVSNEVISESDDAI